MSDLDALEEKLILKRAREGDREAFAEVYDFYVVKIFRFLYLKTNSKETAEDLTSEVFLRSWKYLSGNEEAKIDKIGPLLYKIARNIAIDFYRNKNNQNTVELDESLRNSIPDNRMDIMSSISVKQELEAMRKAINKLKEEYKEIIILRHIEDLSMNEIAHVTGKSEGAVRVLLHRAMKSLSKSINEKSI